MNNSKLINVLRTFSKNELKEFEKFISSTFFNKGRNYISFLSELGRFYPKFDSEKMTQEYIYSRVYPGKKFNKQIIWNASSALLNMAEEFLIFHSLKKNKFARDEALAKEYYERKLPRYFVKTIDEMESKLDRFGMESDYFLLKTRIEGLRKSYNYMEDRQHLVAEHILKEGEYNVLYFLKNIAAYAGDMRSSFLYFNAGYDINMPYEFLKNINLDNILIFVKENNYRYTWIVEMYYYLMMLILDFDNENHFFMLKELLIKNSDKFTPEMRYNWIISLSNYCIMKINKGIDFRRQLFEMNKLNVETGLVFPGRYLLKILYLQILRSALAIGEIQWSEKFIEEYVHKLKPSHQKPIQSLSYAMLYFYSGDYNKVLDNLANVKFIDDRDKIDVKILYLEAYYELNEIEALISLIDSTKHFLSKSSSFTDISRANFMRSLNFLNRLVNAKINNDTDEMELILKEVSEPKGLSIGRWLAAKVKELIEQST